MEGLWKWEREGPGASEEGRLPTFASPHHPKEAAPEIMEISLRPILGPGGGDAANPFAAFGAGAGASLKPNVREGGRVSVCAPDGGPSATASPPCSCP